MRERGPGFWSIVSFNQKHESVENCPYMRMTTFCMTLKTVIYIYSFVPDLSYINISLQMGFRNKYLSFSS